MSEPNQGITSNSLSSDKIYIVDNSFHDDGVCIGEEWKDVPDWPYKASNFGRIRRWYSDLCLTGGTSGPDTHKYPNVILSDSPRKKTFLRHAIIALVFLGPTPKGMEIDHKDGNPFNCRVDNLEFKTPSQNILGAVARGHRGSNRWNAKLNDDVVRTMRLLYGQGWSIRQISDKFQTNFTTTYHVLMGHNWKHVA